MRIGIVSDTHDGLAAVEAAVALFERETDPIRQIGRSHPFRR